MLLTEQLLEIVVVILHNIAFQGAFKVDCYFIPSTLHHLLYQPYLCKVVALLYSIVGTCAPIILSNLPYNSRRIVAKPHRVLSLKLAYHRLEAMQDVERVFHVDQGAVLGVLGIGSCHLSQPGQHFRNDAVVDQQLATGLLTEV